MKGSEVGGRRPEWERSSLGRGGGSFPHFTHCKALQTLQTSFRSGPGAWRVPRVHSTAYTRTGTAVATKLPPSQQGRARVPTRQGERMNEGREIVGRGRCKEERGRGKTQANSSVMPNTRRIAHPHCQDPTSVPRPCCFLLCSTRTVHPTAPRPHPLDQADVVTLLSSLCMSTPTRNTTTNN